MPTPSPVRLLIAESSENRAHEIDSVLRNAGISTRPEICRDLATAARSAEAEAHDLVVMNAGFEHLDQVLPGLRAKQPHLPIIVIEPATDPKSLSRGMALGATDVVWQEDDERLLHVVRRELHHVSERARLRRTQRALEEAERRCQLLLANSSAAIAYVHEGMHIHVNRDYFELFGASDADEMLGVPLMDLIDPDFARTFKAEMKRFRDQGDEVSFDFDGHTTTGEPVVGRMTLASAEYEGEACLQVLVRPSRRADPDPGDDPARAPAGSSFDIFLARGAACVRDAGDAEAAMFVVEIDEFDALELEFGLGELTGVVEQVLAALEEHAAEGTEVARIAHHRFAVAVTAESSAEIEALAENMRHAVEALVLEVKERSVRCSVTIGAVPLPDAEALPGAAQGALRALLGAHRSGSRNCVAWASAASANGSASELSDEQQQTLDRVNNAIEQDDFVLLFQPIISLRGDADEHYEVFLRMVDGGGGQVAPDQFLQLAIDQGVAGKIDRWVILQSIKLLSGHRAKGHNTRLTINVTANSVTDDEFLKWLAVAIKAARLPSDAVIFQITEQDATTHLRQSREFVNGLKDMHCRASLSRFGRIENPFEALAQLPVDFVKLDGSHVDKLDTQAERDALTGLIRQLQSNGKLITVPMVESATVLSALWQAGANYIQGHYLQEPSTDMDYDFSHDD